jgi:hypothetical protein
MTRLTKIILALPLLTITGPAFAVSTPEQVLNDPNRPVEAVARELGVTPLQFATCFAGVTPARTEAELNGELERNNKAILLPCLQAFNPGITNDRLDQVMNKYRAGPPRG